MFQICGREVVLFLSLLSLSIHFTAGLRADFYPSSITVNIADYQTVELKLPNRYLRDDEILRINDKNYLSIHSSDEKVARIENPDQILFTKNAKEDSWEAVFNVTGVFLGSSKVFIDINHINDTNYLDFMQILSVTVMRPKNLIDDIFLYSTVVFLTVVNVNFGAALNLSNIKEILKRPIGPAICCVGQFVFMPLISFGIGALVFDDTELGHALALGLFFCGVVPGGGFSNIWSLLLGGNVDLSVAMTSISIIAAFGMVPLWVFTLGKVIFDRANLTIPYTNVITSATGLIIPLTIGVLIRKFKPNVANFLVRILKPLSLVLIVIMVTSGIISTLYMWQLFNWRIVIAGSSLPWLGYLLGWLVAKLFCQTNTDKITISIEVGMQNTAFAIILLKYAVGQPLADISASVPIASTLTTQLTLSACYILLKIKSKFFDRNSKKFELSSPLNE